MSYEHFYLALPFIEEALEIINETHPSINTFDEIVTKGWDSNSKRSNGLYHSWIHIFLHPVASITQKLQGCTIDIVKAYQEVQSCILDMQVVRDKIEEKFFVIYRQAERIATSLDISPSVPRTVSR